MTIGIVGAHLFVLPMSMVVTGWLEVNTGGVIQVPMLADALLFVPPLVGVAKPASLGRA